jgi:hypothetical protein
LHVGSIHSSTHVPEPDSLHEQFFVQSVRVQRLLFSQLRVHPLPAHDRSTVPEPSAVTVQPPCGHDRLQGPLPSQRNSQPAPGHWSVQGSEVTHWQSCPGVQLVELDVAVVATQATQAITMAAKQAWPTQHSIELPALRLGLTAWFSARIPMQVARGMRNDSNDHLGIRCCAP